MRNRLLSTNDGPGEMLWSCQDAGVGGAGIADVSDSARGSATRFSSRPFSYGEWGFTAMAVNRAIFSHGGRVGLTRADAELQGKSVLKGEAALVDSSSPRHGEEASYYSVMCLQTGDVEWMELEGNRIGESSVAFLEQFRERYGGRLDVIWDNAPVHRGPAMRSYLKTPSLNLRLVNMPGYSPDFNADEPVWGWVREEATENPCLGSKALNQ